MQRKGMKNSKVFCLSFIVDDYDVRTIAIGEFIVMADKDGKEVDPGEYVTFPTYFNFWKREYNDLKVSQLVEDICKDC
jgi:hypothetical protein